jgi:hypothetical protein
VLTGCDSQSPIDPTPQSTINRLSLSSFPSSVLLSESAIDVTAVLKNDIGNGRMNVPVQFSADAGRFEPPVAITNSPSPPSRRTVCR